MSVYSLKLPGSFCDIIIALNGLMEIIVVNNIVIVGSGPAGLTCGIYAARAGFAPILIAGENPGGQLVNTDHVENFPGFVSITGADLMMKMLEQTEKLGVEILYDTVTSIEKKPNDSFRILLDSGHTIASKTVIVATGAKHKHLAVPGEAEFTNKGVSWCATCDGPIYKGKRVAVTGGGNVALMEALFLANFACEVFLIHRRDVFRADKIIQSRVFECPKIKIIWNSTVTAIGGTERLTHVFLNEEEKLDVEALFVAVGTIPISDFVKNIVECDEHGYIKAHSTTTSCPGIFAAGDVVSGSLKQAVFAAGQGALALTKAEEYIARL